MSDARTTGAVAIIPVRVDSQRLPGKALLSDSGRPLFLHTCAQAVAAACFDQVLVATDSERVRAATQAAGLTAVLTSDRPRSGSERCAEAIAQAQDPEIRDCEVVVDIQGDWPEVDPADLQELCEVLRGNEGDRACATLAASLTDPVKIADPNVVKVVRGRSGAALYFSRLPVPYDKNADPSGAGSGRPLLRHIGVYAFTRRTLLAVPGLPSSGLDDTEGLEQLRFLENDIEIQVLDAQGDPWGIECRADYEAFLLRHAQRTP